MSDYPESGYNDNEDNKVDIEAKEEDEDQQNQQQEQQQQGRTLTELMGDDDEEEEEEDQDEGEGSNGGNNNNNEEEGEQVGEGESEEEDDDDDDEDEEEDRPKKKKRRRPKGGNQFLDIEADVDDEEEDDDDEGEEGFVPLDNFIENRADRPQKARGGIEGEILPMEDDAGDYADGDASHRLLDRRLNKAKDREAEELAASFVTRYGKSKYDAEAGSEEWAPKALLMPGVNDASIWGLKCKTGRERELVLSLSRKAAALAASDNAQPLQIISAFQRDSIKGYIYIEARSESHVRNAIVGLIGIYLGTPGGVFLVDIEEMPDLLRTKQKKVEVLPGGWVRIKRGKYAGDLAQIVDISENGEDLVLKFIPRIDLTPKDNSLKMGSDGKKRKKGGGAALAFRPPQRMFNPEEIAKIYGNKEVSKRSGGTLTFKGDTYKDGYLEKDVKQNALILENVTPSLDELTQFLGESGTKGVNADGSAGFDLSHMAEIARKAAKLILQPGDHVEVFEGDQRGIYGSIDSIQNDVVIMTPHAELHLPGATKVEVQARSVRKRFRAGDHVKVMNGSNVDETGLVVKVKDDVVTFLSDLSLSEVTVFSKDIREAAEVGSGVNIIGQYELHDLVQLDPQTTGVIFKIERDTFRILDQTGTVRSLKPSQISGKVNSRGSVATDHNGLNISNDDEMVEIEKTAGVPRKGRILHVYRSLWAFLHNRDIGENSGVFVTYARSLTPTAKSKATVKSASGLNPDRFGKAPATMAPIVGGRPDGRIHRNVLVTRGAYKGYSGVIKDITAGIARVELYTNSKVITMAVELLKEQKSDGTLIELNERPAFVRDSRPSSGGDRSSGGGNAGAGGFGDRQNGFPRRQGFQREDSTASTSSIQSGFGGGKTPFPNAGAQFGGRTPFPGAAGGGGGRTPYNGGRTPAPGNSGFASGRTPAPNSGGSGSGFDPSSRTPAYNPNNASASFNPSSRTPAHPSSSNSAFNPNSRTPHYSGSNSTSDPWSANSRTPFHPSLQSDNSGGKTPDPRAGGRTPMYGAKSSYTGREDRGEGSSTGSNRSNLGLRPPQSAPTPASRNDDPWSENGAPTPAANAPHDYNRPQAKTPYGAPTPYTQPDTPGAGASTPGVFSAPTPAYGGAPTPAAYNGAPTPAAYTGAPTPYSAQTPGAYGAPTPGVSGGYTQTPGAYGGGAGATPGAGYTHTPGMYHGAATAAAQPLEYQQRVQAGSTLPSDWAVMGLKVQFLKSPYDAGKYDNMDGIIFGTNGGSCDVAVEPDGVHATGVPSKFLQPAQPSKPGEPVLILSGDYRGQNAITQSRDGNEWMVQMSGGQTTIVAAAILCVTLD